MSKHSQTSKTLFNCNNMVDPIKRIILKHPKDAFINQNKIDSEYKSLNFLGAPDLKESSKEFKHFTKILNSFDIKLQIFWISWQKLRRKQYLLSQKIISYEPVFGN